MPHIRVDAYDERRQIKQINIHAEIVFDKLAWVNRAKANLRMDEFKEKLEALLSEYFDGSAISSDIYSNQAWRNKMHGY